MGKSKHSVNSTSQSTLLHKGRTERNVAVHAGLRCATCADLQSSFCQKSKGSHWPMCLALRESIRLRSWRCSLFGIASESDVDGPGSDLPLLCLFPMATRDKLKCRRRLSSFLPIPFICFWDFSDIVWKTIEEPASDRNRQRNGKQRWRTLWKPSFRLAGVANERINSGHAQREREVFQALQTGSRLPRRIWRFRRAAITVALLLWDHY